VSKPLPKPVFFCESLFTPTSYKDLSEVFYDGAPDKPTVVDFTNTHITVLRLTDPEFRRCTESVDHFVPDSMPLTWCVNLAAGKTVMPDRVYGPEFMNRFLRNSPPHIKHYFLGSSEDCLADLIKETTNLTPRLNICGSHHGYFTREEWPRILEQINASAPDFIWVGLGTPKQQEFTSWAKDKVNQGWLLNVGFAFDVNAGRKSDAPKWMQSVGLTWLYRLASEPKRLGPRYAKFNSLFLLYAFEWFMTNHWLTGLLRQSWLLLLGLLATMVIFLTWSMINLPASLPFIGLAILSFVGAWTGSILAMAASEQEEDEFAPSKKGLNIAAVVGVIGVILCLLLLPLLGLIDPGARWSVAVASTALSFSATAYLALLLLVGGVVSFLARRNAAARRRHTEPARAVMSK
jgi:N-acetylglucosaminyldiphosphoundecaprenol N-acetyl-beta-D-mannosaminyltransferase